MGKIVRNLKSYSGFLVTLAIALIALFFVLNFVANKGWGPLSTAASWAEAHANGSAYDSVPAAAPVVVPSSSPNGPAI